MNNSDPSGMSFFDQCSGLTGEAAAACDEAILYPQEYGPLPASWLVTLNTVVDTVGGAVAGGVVGTVIAPAVGTATGVVVGAGLGYTLSKTVSSPGNYITPSYIGLSLNSALNIDYLDVYTQSPYYVTGSTLANMGGLQSYESAVVQYDPAFCWFQGMLGSQIGVSVVDEALIKVLGKTASGAIALTGYSIPSSSQSATSASC